MLSHSNATFDLHTKLKFEDRCVAECHFTSVARNRIIFRCSLFHANIRIYESSYSALMLVKCLGDEVK